ncbi:MAG: HYR domain-containing protein [Vicinamibacteraceae bacterium]|nr:HYR domain-containing protein [Vicinamibacteraceae bacterium]
MLMCYRRPDPIPLLITLAAVVWAGCGSDSRPPSTPSPVPPPGLSLNCPSPVNTVATGASGAVVTFATPTASGGTPPTSVSCTPASGTTFAIGTTSVRCTATDATSATASCTFDVVVAPPPGRLTATTFLAFGDSVTAGEITVAAPAPTWAAGSGGRFDPLSQAGPLELRPELSYPTRLREILAARYPAQAAEITVVNAGRSGERAVDAPLRLGNLLANSPPQVLLLLHGYNDLGSQQAMEAALVAMNAMAKDARFRGVPVYLASLTPPRPGGVRSIDEARLLRYNERLADVARGENATFVDLYAGLSSNVQAWIGSDGLHPTEAGYRRIAEVFFEALAADLHAPARSERP